MGHSIEISQDDSLFYSLAEKKISKDFNAAAVLDGFQPLAQMGYDTNYLDSKGNGLSLAASVTAVAGEGIRANASAIQQWNRPIDADTLLTIRAGMGLEASSRDGMNAAMKVRADYIRAESISPYFTVAASTRSENSLSVGAGACKDVEVPGLNVTSTVCAGVEVRGDRPAAAFSIGRNF